MSADLPVGAALENWSARPKPGRVTLEGRTVRLEPLGVNHAGDLFRAWHQVADADAWTYLNYDRPVSIAAAEGFITAVSAQDVFFAITSRATGVALGVAAYIRVDPGNGVIEVAHIHFSPRLKRTRMATEAIFLLLSHAFDTLGYRRCEWKCDSLNAPSRDAALRFGFTFEGIFRQAMVVKERNRDTAWYAIIDKEWPAIRKAFEVWLDETNFDAAGMARRRLSQLMEAADESSGG